MDNNSVFFEDKNLEIESGRKSADRRNDMTVSVFLGLVVPAGFEPATHSLEGCCSIQLSYRTPERPPDETGGAASA